MIVLIINALALGVALSVDSFSLCLADILIERAMVPSKKVFITVMHAVMQAAMPVAGYLMVRFVASVLNIFLKLTPYISFALLGYLGVKMILEAVHPDKATKDIKGTASKAAPVFGLGSLLMQGVAASIDALSVGFVLASSSFAKVLFTALIIALVTAVFCAASFTFGGALNKISEKKLLDATATKQDSNIAKEKLSKRANIAGGIILIAIGVELFVQGLL